LNFIHTYSIVGASYYNYQNEVEKGLIVMSTNNVLEKLKTFKTIETGTYTDVKTVLKAMEEIGAGSSYWAGSILNKTELSKSKQSLDLVVPSVRELGFPNGAMRMKIYEAGRNQGLDLSPAEVGPQLLLQYPDQPIGTGLVIAMEPITDSDSGLFLFLFLVCNYDGGRYLDAFDGRPDRFYYPNDRFVFVRRK